VVKIASISIADYCEATAGMPFDVERLYFRMILKMLSREAGIPDDDAENARAFGYDPRVYRRLKAKLIAWPRALYLDDGLLKNERVENDIEAVRIRRAEKSENGRKGGLAKAAVSQKSETSSAEVQQKSGRISYTTDSEINNIALASPSPTPSPEVERESKPVRTEQGAADGPSEIPGLNGSTSLIVKTFAEWLNPWAPDVAAARKTIADAVGIYGDRAVRDGFAELKADVADGKLRIPTAKSFYGYCRTAKDRGGKASTSTPVDRSKMEYIPPLYGKPGRWIPKREAVQ
jgi:uncharacterized protein YdaU (DUF1376 family)